MTESAVSVSDLKLTYPGAACQALKGIDLEVKKGEFIVLAGLSGCGKTSLIRCLNGIIPHLLSATLEGDIRLFGRSVYRLSPETISGMAGSVFQDPRAQFFHVNVTDEIAFGPENMGFDRKKIRRRVDRAFARFGIEHLRDRQMFGLSSGEKQKVIFAAVHAMGPTLYILDEPSSNLDASAIEDLRKALTDLKSEGCTIVAVEHRLYYLSRLFDRLVIMDQGKIVKEIFSPDQLTPQISAGYGLRSLVLPPPDAGPIDGQKTTQGPGAVAGSDITVADIEFSYPGTAHPVLYDVSTQFLRGSKTAVVGLNGSGKTTFIKVLCGLLKENAGRIMSGKHRFSPGLRLHRCGFVMQESSHQLFFPTVLEEMASGMGRKVCHKRVTGLLEELGLAGVSREHPQTLSGGQQQRLVIGAALAPQPDILILDEPTSGLDAFHMRRLAECLDREASKGIPVVVVTHDLEFIRVCCDRILFLSLGRAACLSPVNRPDTRVTALFSPGLTNPLKYSGDPPGRPQGIPAR